MFAVLCLVWFSFLHGLMALRLVTSDASFPGTESGGDDSTIGADAGGTLCHPVQHPLQSVLRLRLPALARPVLASVILWHQDRGHRTVCFGDDPESLSIGRFVNR